MVKYAFYCISLFISFSALALDKVTASIDKNPAIEGESLVLEVIANDAITGSKLDTSALLKDFIVGRTSSSTQSRIINGKSDHKTQWTTVLIPLKTGQVTIPALSVNGIKTQPIIVDVLDKSHSALQKSKDIFITAETDKQSVYVQEQFSLTIKLHFGVGLETASLSDPKMQNATIVQTGKDSQQEEIINGRRYQVIERQYSITPLSSGDYTLEMPIFSGQVHVQTQRRGGVFGFPQTKPVSVITDPISMNIKPQPASFQGTWLPSELVVLHQEWQPDEASFKVGEPITRTITLNAIGLTKEQLPTIETPSVRGIKIYPDQPQLHSAMRENRLVSQAVVNFAIVASKEGTFELPAIEIPWWNTVTNKQEIASIPAKKITIQANPDYVQNIPTVNNQLNSTLDASDPELNHQTAETLSNTQTVVIKQHSWLQWLFLVLWILTSIIWALSAWRKKQTNKPNQPITYNEKPYLNLKQACKNNNAQQALNLIIPWVKSISHHDENSTEINNINEALSILNDKELTNEIKQLQESLYGKSPSTWQGNQLLSIVTVLSKKQLSLTKKQGIALNP